MEAYLTPSNVMFVLGILGIMFSVYSYFRNPQLALDKKQALDSQEADGKAALLAQQLQWNAEATERRFAEMGTRITEAMSLAQNHIHTVDTKVDAIGGAMVKMGNEIVKLSTIIDERIPAKK